MLVYHTRQGSAACTVTAENERNRLHVLFTKLRFGNYFLGPFNQEKQLEAEKFLKALVYAAAEAGAMRLIETIFSLPAGRVVFESYKEESLLPEDIAEENGHGKVAAYLRGKTKRSVDVLCVFHSLKHPFSRPCCSKRKCYFGYT